MCGWEGVEEAAVDRNSTREFLGRFGMLVSSPEKLGSTPGAG